MAEKDFIGFTFDGIHSDTMGIYVSVMEIDIKKIYNLK